MKFDLPIDAKYKLYDKLKIENEDIYQCFLYAFAYAHPQHGRLPAAILLYPGTTKLPTEQVLEIRNTGGKILGKVYAMSIHIPSLLQEMADNVLGAGSAMIFDRIQQALSNLV